MAAIFKPLFQWLSPFVKSTPQVLMINSLCTEKYELVFNLFWKKNVKCREITGHFFQVDVYFKKLSCSHVCVICKQY